MKAQDTPKGWPEGWLVALAAAVLSALVAGTVGEVSLFAALLIGVFVFLVFGVLLGMFWGVPAPQGTQTGGHGSPDHSAQDRTAPGQSARGQSAPGQSAPGHGALGQTALGQSARGHDLKVHGHGPVPASAILPAVPVLVGLSEHEALEGMVAEDKVVTPATPAPLPMPPTAPQSFADIGSVPAAQPESVEPVPVRLGAADASALGGGQPDGMVVSPALADTIVAPPAEPEVAEPVPGQPGTADASAVSGARPQGMVVSQALADAIPAPLAEPEVAPPMPVPPPAAVVAADGAKPQGLAAPRDGVADRLQVIEGIGPVLEKLCHDLGIYHFDQIAGWGPAEVAWMDGNLKGFKGRVTRDKWVRQAALIGTAGLEEFQRRARSNEY